jgi:DNA-binding MarR family transcriptional regulator
MDDRSLVNGATRDRRQLTELCFEVVRRLRSRAAELAAEFDLSLLQTRALWHIEQPLPTGALADRLGLDPSNLTSVVDRLEARGLVTRRAHRDDRRVKVLTLTESGRALRAALDDRVFRSVTLFDRLTEVQQAELASLLSTILAEPASSPVGG